MINSKLIRQFVHLNRMNYDLSLNKINFTEKEKKREREREKEKKKKKKRTKEKNYKIDLSLETCITQSSE